jgi:hypothetical protein
MDAEGIARKFEAIGAAAVVERTGAGRRPYSLDVQERKGRETFLIRVRPDSAVELEVLDAQPADRHLLLLVRENGAKNKLLCGHDERHWFVAAVPEGAGASTVASAKEALKPQEVHVRQRGMKARERNRRRNEAYVRQGEWFFVPAPEMEARIRPEQVLRSEPLFRAVGGRIGKAHTVQEAARLGGEVVYVDRGRMLSEVQYRRLPEAERTRYTARVRNPELYCRGTVRHPDHKTIRLQGWHRVFMNTESLASFAERVEFLD